VATAMRSRFRGISLDTSVSRLAGVRVAMLVPSPLSEVAPFAAAHRS
jgi:hypothetical protein